MYISYNSNEIDLMKQGYLFTPNSKHDFNFKGLKIEEVILNVRPWPVWIIHL